jgi:hypothetical protein
MFCHTSDHVEGLVEGTKESRGIDVGCYGGVAFWTGNYSGNGIVWHDVCRRGYLSRRAVFVSIRRVHNIGISIDRHNLLENVTKKSSKYR